MADQEIERISVGGTGPWKTVPKPKSGGGGGGFTGWTEDASNPANVSSQGADLDLAGGSLSADILSGVSTGYISVVKIPDDTLTTAGSVAFGASTNPNGGGVTVAGGDADPAAAGAGGDVGINGGGGALTGTAGNVSVAGGTNSNGGPGGSVTIQSGGAYAGAGNAGLIQILPGFSVGGTKGQVQIFDANGVQRITVDEHGTAFNGVTVGTVPVIPATPSPQDIATALVALGLCTQAA